MLGILTGTRLKFPVTSYTDEVFDITKTGLDYNGVNYEAKDVTDEILLNSRIFGNKYITKLNMSGCSKVSQEAWMIFLESFGKQIQYLKLQGCTGLTNLDWICRADYREQKAWYSNYTVDVNGVNTNVKLGPDFYVGTTDGDNNLSVKGYYYIYTKNDDGKTRKLSKAAGETIGTIVNKNGLDMKRGCSV